MLEGEGREDRGGDLGGEYQYSKDAVALYVIDWAPISFENLSLLQARVDKILQLVETHEVIITAQEWNVCTSLRFV